MSKVSYLILTLKRVKKMQMYDSVEKKNSAGSHVCSDGVYMYIEKANSILIEYNFILWWYRKDALRNIFLNN